MKKFNCSATMVCNAVVEAKSEGEARGIFLTLLLNVNDANKAQSGFNYGVTSVTEFSFGYNREDEHDVDEATDIECGQCEGTGTTDAMGGPEECPVCDGSGQVAP